MATCLHTVQQNTAVCRAFWQPESSTSKCRLTAGGHDTILIRCVSYGGAGGVAEGKTAELLSCKVLDLRRSSQCLSSTGSILPGSSQTICARCPLRRSPSVPSPALSTHFATRATASPASKLKRSESPVVLFLAWTPDLLRSGFLLCPRTGTLSRSSR